MLNGEDCSEFMLYSWCAAYYGVPTVFLSGDKMLTEDSLHLHPMLKTVWAKDGYGGYTRCRQPQLVCDLIRKGTEERPIIFGKTVTSPDVIAIREGVLSGLGVSVDMPLVQCWEEVRDGKLVPILPGWHRPQIECFVVLSSSSWRKRRCRVFAEWFSKALQKLFQGFEDAVSGIVALEPRKGAQG